MIIGSIVDGIVIDHIPAGRGMELYRLLNLEPLTCEVAVITNADSGKVEKKDILKIGQIIDLDLSVLGYISTKITVNYIQNGERVKKVHPELPQTITNMITCKNPRCITTIEQELPQVFKLADANTGTYRCMYCETKAGKSKQG